MTANVRYVAEAAAIQYVKWGMLVVTSMFK